jgi:branched-chain amino acid transport system substrate-binding protein
MHDSRGAPPGIPQRTARIAAAAWVCITASACSLGNISPEECESGDECARAFGLGSSCDEGYCDDPDGCRTGHDCRRLFGGGACVDAVCRLELPPDPFGACRLYEPENLPSKPLAGVGSPLLVGGIFRLDESADQPMSKGVQLGIREITSISGLNEGREVALVLCDNGGPGNSLSGDARRERMFADLDYLAGTLGVPYIVGPVTSSDALVAIGHIVGQRYPTVLISPSATSPQLSVEPDRLDAQDPFGLFWRTAASDDVQGRILAEQVIGRLPQPEAVSDVAVVFIDDAYGNGLATVFGDLWIGGGGTRSLFPFNDDSDWNQIAAGVAASTPEVIVLIAIDASQALGFLGGYASQPTLAGIKIYLTDGSKDAATLLDPSVDAELQEILFNDVYGTGPAAPSGADFDFFAAALAQDFGIDARGFSFVANAYDAAYVGAMGVVYASRDGNRFDGLQVAEGLSRLITGSAVVVGKSEWAAAKAGLTSGDFSIDVRGISGALDFDPAVGEGPAPIEVWRPSDEAADCLDQPPCFTTITVL